MKAYRTLLVWLLVLPGLSSAEGPPKQEVGLIYSPVGKRDPFRVPAAGRELASINPLERFSIEQLQLRGILRGDGQARAMFEDPEGRTHIIREGELLGREQGTVSRILNTEVIITEKTFNYRGEESLYEKIISLPQK